MDVLASPGKRRSVSLQKATRRLLKGRRWLLGHVSKNYKKNYKIKIYKIKYIKLEIKQYNWPHI